MYSNAERTKAVMMLKELSEQRTPLYLPAFTPNFRSVFDVSRIVKNLISNIQWQIKGTPHPLVL